MYTQDQPQPSLQSQFPNPSPQPPKKRTPWLLLVCSVIIVLLIGVIISLYLFKAASRPTVQSSTSATATPIPTAIAQPAHLGRSAVQILVGLQAKGLSIGPYFNYTADNDLNKLLGRPFQYTGKVNFKDTRIGASTNQGANISVSDGGSIEVFGTTSDALNRFNYLQALSKSGSAIFAEYEYLDGTVVMRISSQLTPTQADAYKVALKALP